jgi:hypothetical protein
VVLPAPRIPQRTICGVCSLLSEEEEGTDKGGKKKGVQSLLKSNHTVIHVISKQKKLQAAESQAHPSFPAVCKSPPCNPGTLEDQDHQAVPRRAGLNNNKSKKIPRVVMKIIMFACSLLRMGYH